MDEKTALQSAEGQARRAWNIGGLLDWTARFLADKGSESPRLDTEVLLAHALGCRRIELYTRYEEEASAEARQRFRELVRRRVEGCPVAYLVGAKEFFALRLEVNPAVLIPRPESEFIVMECLRLAKPMAQPKILEIGTGSGNIAVAVAKGHPAAELTAVDLSADALTVARRNAERHGVAERIRFLQGDLFEPLAAGERFAFILSNPPYIAEAEMSSLPAGVRDYEPHLALNGGPGGYSVVDRIISAAANHLEAVGYLILEIGAPQEKHVREQIERQGGYQVAATIHDYSGHARVVQARRV
jgi:release factor glutamine methyltransferase